jgi:hypothetical protein
MGLAGNTVRLDRSLATALCGERALLSAFVGAVMSLDIEVVWFFPLRR